MQIPLFRAQSKVVSFSCCPHSCPYTDYRGRCSNMQGDKGGSTLWGRPCLFRKAIKRRDHYGLREPKPLRFGSPKCSQDTQVSWASSTVTRSNTFFLVHPPGLEPGGCTTVLKRQSPQGTAITRFLYLQPCLAAIYAERGCLSSIRGVADSG